jgi:hypothetical protein
VNGIANNHRLAEAEAELNGEKILFMAAIN